MLFLIIGGTGAWFIANSIIPTYESTGTMMINDGTNNNEMSQIISQTTGFGTNATLINEVQILGSRKFASDVAGKLIKQEPGDINEFPVLWVEEEDGEVYKASQDLVATRIRNNLTVEQTQKESNVVELSFQSESPDEAAKVVNLAMEVYVENSTEQNREATEKTAQFLEKQKKEIQEKLAKSEQRLEEYMDSTGIVKMDQQASEYGSRPS
ncbi:MAG: hypothetical protein U5K69_19060 [Balneolaceae bacterium]|nr:hypothetical protein [Balneolaceae bacterium]